MHANSPDLAHLAQSIKDWGRELGFQQVGITDVQLGEHEQHLKRWLDAGYQGEMDYMAAHGSKRAHPDELVPGTLRVVSLRMDYLPGDTRMSECLAQPEKAYVSRYALGRDYHKLIRKRLQQLAERIQQAIGPFGYRAFVDSAANMDMAAVRESGAASPLEVVLGLKPAPKPASAPKAPENGQDAAQEPPAAAPGMSEQMGAAAQSASKAWWDLLQQQFNQIAAATAASMAIDQNTGVHGIKYAALRGQLLSDGQRLEVDTDKYPPFPADKEPPSQRRIHDTEPRLDSACVGY